MASEAALPDDELEGLVNGCLVDWSARLELGRRFLFRIGPDTYTIHRNPAGVALPSLGRQQKDCSDF
jgi:hypothetical protein